MVLARLTTSREANHIAVDHRGRSRVHPRCCERRLLHRNPKWRNRRLLPSRNRHCDFVPTRTTGDNSESWSDSRTVEGTVYQEQRDDFTFLTPSVMRPCAKDSTKKRIVAHCHTVEGVQDGVSITTGCSGAQVRSPTFPRGKCCPRWFVTTEDRGHLCGRSTNELTDFTHHRSLKLGSFFLHDSRCRIGLRQEPDATCVLGSSSTTNAVTSRCAWKRF